MPLWGNKDNVVTANSTTTVESTNGAPIGVHSLVKGSGRGSSPISMATNSAFGNTSAGSAASVDVNLFNNTTPSAFLSGVATGIFGVSATEMANNTANASKEMPAHAGWVYRKAGTGPIVGAAISGGTASGYSNNDYIVVSSPVAGGNAKITYTTNSTGGNLAFTVVTPGFGFTNTTIPVSNVFVVNSTGGSTGQAGNTTTTYVVVNAGGRAGRVQTETLVAMGSLTSDSTSDNTFYPGT